MLLSNWLRDTMLSREYVRYVKTFRGSPVNSYEKPFFHCYVLSVAYIRKERDGYVLYVKHNDRVVYKEISLNINKLKLKGDIKLISLGYKINSIGIW